MRLKPDDARPRIKEIVRLSGNRSRCPLDRDTGAIPKPIHYPSSPRSLLAPEEVEKVRRIVRVGRSRLLRALETKRCSSANGPARHHRSGSIGSQFARRSPSAVPPAECRSAVMILKTLNLRSAWRLSTRTCLSWPTAGTTAATRR